MDLKRRHVLALAGTTLLPLAGCSDTSVGGPRTIGDGEVSPAVPGRAIGPDEPEELFVSVTSADEADTLFDYGSLSGSKQDEVETFISDTDFGIEVIVYAEVRVSDTSNVLAVEDVTNEAGDAVVTFVQQQPTLTADEMEGSVRRALVRVSGSAGVDSVTVEYSSSGGAPETYEPQSVGDLE